MIHKNSIKSYRELPPDSVLEVARELLRQQRAGLKPTANTIGRSINKPSSSVTYRLEKTGNTINPITNRPNAVWQLVAPTGQLSMF